jgi:hypothetical protein
LVSADAWGCLAQGVLGGVCSMRQYASSQGNHAKLAASLAVTSIPTCRTKPRKQPLSRGCRIHSWRPLDQPTLDWLFDEGSLTRRLTHLSTITSASRRCSKAGSRCAMTNAPRWACRRRGLGARGVPARPWPALGVRPQRGRAQCWNAAAWTWKPGQPLAGRVAVLRPGVHPPPHRSVQLSTGLAACRGRPCRAVGAPLALRACRPRPAGGRSFLPALWQAAKEETADVPATAQVAQPPAPTGLGLRPAEPHGPPIGIYLLLWPTLWPCGLPAMAHPAWPTC